MELPKPYESGADERDRTADLLITNQPVLWVFFPENEALGGYLGGYARAVFRLAGLRWEVIFDWPRAGVRASRIPLATYGVCSRRDSITSQGAG